MALASSTAPTRPLISLAVYCPLLCQDREEKAQDNILFFSPSHTNVNKQMNQVGFCIAMSSLAPRFGVPCSNRQTIRKQRSSVCLYRPMTDLCVSAHVRGGYGEAETTHQLLRLSFSLFELLYGRAALVSLTKLPADATTADEQPTGTTDADASAASQPNDGDVNDARAALQSFWSRCAVFLSDVLAAQQRALADGTAALPLETSPVLSQAGWAQYLRAEAAFGFPLHFADVREGTPWSLGGVEDVVHRVLWARAWARVGALQDPPAVPRCCVFGLQSLFVQMADSRLPCGVLQAIKFYLLLYAPISSSSFACHLPDEGLCEVAVWREGVVVVVLVEPPQPQPMHAAGAANASSPGASPAASLLECASAIGADVVQLLQRPLRGLTTPVERDTCWLATSSAPRHALTSLSKVGVASATTAASPNTLILHARFVGGVVEGTSVFTLWPGLMEHLRTMIHTTKLTVAATPCADAAWECWTRWTSVWIYLRFSGPTVHMLAWRSPVDFRQLSFDVKRHLLMSL